MAEQQLNPELWEEFEAEYKKELEKIKTNPISSLQSESLDEFWKKFLTEQFPTGKINEQLEKNFAIFVCQNKLDIENIKSLYSKNGWTYQALLGWIKKVNNGELTTFNIKELLSWANTFSKGLIPLLEKAQEELTEELLPIIPMDELDNLEEEENIWLCNRLIRPKSICTISGKRSTLKTWLALCLGVSISSHIPFLEKFKTEQGNVLFIDGESNKIEIKKRKNLIKKYLKIDNLYNFFVLSEYYLKMDTNKGIRQLERQIKNMNIKLVICDSYRRFITFDENDATQTSQFFIDYLKPICIRTGASFLFIHHEKKGQGKEDDDMDSIRGSSDFANLMDSIIQVKRKGTRLTIRQTKNKFGIEVPGFNIELKTDEKNFFGFKFLGLDETIDVTCARIIFNWAIKKKSFTYTEALKHAESKNFKPDTFKKSLKALEERNLVQKGEGKKSPYKIISKVWAEAEI